MLDSFIAVDIETTGLNPATDSIIEIGAVKIVKGKTVSEYSQLIHQDHRLPLRIIELTGIDDSMVAKAKEAGEVLGEFLNYVGEDILLGHNLIFDYSFLKQYYAATKLPFEKRGIDTLKIARSVHPELESRKLSHLCEYYGIENPSGHRAFYDAWAAKELYFKMAEQFFHQRERIFSSEPLFYKAKKEYGITKKQKNYLLDLVKYHKIETQSLWNGEKSIDDLSKSEASKMIDNIILNCGRILR